MTDLATDWYGGHNATFGDWIAAARAAAQMSWQHLSKHLDVRFKTMKSWKKIIAQSRVQISCR